jgi:hypothetical protein
MMKKPTIDGSVIITFLLEKVPDKPIPGMTSNARPTRE